MLKTKRKLSGEDLSKFTEQSQKVLIISKVVFFKEHNKNLPASEDIIEKKETLVKMNKKK
jgi:hypothetical protein